MKKIKFIGEVSIMQIKWKKLMTKLIIWLITEILLNFAGLDNLADYSEFVFEKNFAMILLT